MWPNPQFPAVCAVYCLEKKEDLVYWWWIRKFLEFGYFDNSDENNA